MRLLTISLITLIGGTYVNKKFLSRGKCIDNGKTIEVVRLCTDGTDNVCSFLYSRAARIAKEMGYEKIITYILESEDGASLRASGWEKEADTNGGSWNCKSRPRNTTAPTYKKQRWARNLI